MRNRIERRTSFFSREYKFVGNDRKGIEREQFRIYWKCRLIKEREVNQWLNPRIQWNNPQPLQWNGQCVEGYFILCMCRPKGRFFADKILSWCYWKTDRDYLRLLTVAFCFCCCYNVSADRNTIICNRVMMVRALPVKFHMQRKRNATYGRTKRYP